MDALRGGRNTADEKGLIKEGRHLYVQIKRPSFRPDLYISFLFISFVFLFRRAASLCLVAVCVVFGQTSSAGATAGAAAAGAGGSLSKEQ
jgi:hypothetical protein